MGSDAKISVSALEKAEREATPGPWRGGGSFVCRCHDEDQGPWIDIPGAGIRDNFVSIVALRNAAPALLAVLRAAKAESEECEPCLRVALSSRDKSSYCPRHAALDAFTFEE